MPHSFIDADLFHTGATVNVTCHEGHTFNSAVMTGDDSAVVGDDRSLTDVLSYVIVECQPGGTWNVSVEQMCSGIYQCLF